MNEMQYKFDRTSTSDVEYIGKAASGVATSEKKWDIMRITYDENGDVLEIKNARDKIFQQFSWDERTTLTYS